MGVDQDLLILNPVNHKIHSSFFLKRTAKEADKGLSVVGQGAIILELHTGSLGNILLCHDPGYVVNKF